MSWSRSTEHGESAVASLLGSNSPGNSKRRATRGRVPPVAAFAARATSPRAGCLNGRSVPGLELVDVLGSGGMGVVFKARQTALDRDVAVKFLRDAHRAEPGRRERFIQEARAIARLRHPHLVQLYEFGEVPAAGGAASQPYLVLEYVSGGSLADLLRGSPQPPGRPRGWSQRWPTPSITPTSRGSSIAT